MSLSDNSRLPLHPIEKSILLFLSTPNQKDVWSNVSSISIGSSLSLDQVRRGIEWLKAKSLIDLQEEQSDYFSLGPEGKSVLVQGLPERRLVSLLKILGGKSSLESLSKSLGSEFSIALGRSRKNNWIRLIENSVVLNTENPDNKEPEELLIEKLGSKVRIQSTELSSEERSTMDSLKRRHKGIVEELSEKSTKLRLNIQGMMVAGTINKDEIDEITPEVILNESWRNRPIRGIDVTSPGPRLYAGRKHPVRMFIDEVKEVFVSLGFEEIEGPMVQSALWNFDALFIPQQHPTREMQDTFYLSGISSELSGFTREVNAIRHSHESGKGTGSIGWQYKWSLEEARRVVLRTHTTGVTIKYLSDYKPKDARVFLVGKVFRNEKPNYKHLPEFYQIDGVTVGPNLNIRNLIHIIGEFYSKLGFDKIKFWPTFFPYTEPSLQTVVFFEKKQKWIELGGMGVFRPEVTIPLGVKNPVLAWGLGMDRLIMLRYDLNDIRDLFGANLGWLRKTRVQ